MSKKIIKQHKLGFPWITLDPFLFCVHHLDFYPKGNGEMGPDASLQGRNIGNDFVIKDGWRMYHGDKVPGFPAHPHRGFETVTFVTQGMVDHADSAGGNGRYGNRDVQWMTAGSGLQHSEMFPLLDDENPNTTELFQIWLNLPKAKKMTSPSYKMLWNENIPEAVFEDESGRKTTVDIVAGSIGEYKAPEPTPDSWAAEPDHEVAIWQIHMDASASWQIPAAGKGVNRMLYFFEGDILQVEDETVHPGSAVELEASENVEIKNGENKCRCLLLQGKPIRERVVQYGPFVMNSEAEIQAAFQDYRDTEFGGWPWPRHDQVFNKNKGRFAQFTDGTEVVKE
ncbi:pirin family protein [Maribellus sediminis]|uniref:pirin family protein n=1 Tax=Maribellus sediminis TaxID=2696285 RepID=UPI00142FE87F|nr:pirin-like C-terminal cupin domain-containing protein [Maribellus sediminis]